MLTQEYLKLIFDYNPNTGTFIWLNSRGRAKKGNMLNSLDSKGYISVEINNKAYRAHRLAWLYVYGEWPKNQIDHINGIRNDNRIKNLRNVTCLENAKNKKCHRLGHPLGISYFKRDNNWRAYISLNYKHYHIGYYKTQNEAKEAYESLIFMLKELKVL